MMRQHGTRRNSLVPLVLVLSALLLFSLNQIRRQNSILSLDKQSVQQQDVAKLIIRSNSTTSTPVAAPTLTEATTSTSATIATSTGTGSNNSSSSSSTNTTMIHDDYVIHHELISPKSTADLILNTSSSDYKWVGKAWIPPQGVPVFTPSQIRAYFTKHNILILGDSTSR